MICEVCEEEYSIINSPVYYLGKRYILCRECVSEVYTIGGNLLERNKLSKKDKLIKRGYMKSV